MPKTAQAAPQPSVQELRVSGHLMSMEPGLFCVFQTPGTAIDDGSGLPGVRLSLPPDGPAGQTPLEFAGFRDDGWVGEFNDAVLVRVRRPCQMMVTIYQAAHAEARSPNLQVVRLATPVAPNVPAPVAGQYAAPGAVAAQGAAAATRLPKIENAEIAAHIQGRGDVPGVLNTWVGEPGSGSWIEGFSISPTALISAEDIEYQAVLGRGWLSPWMQGGEFCGSRGMALPVLGLRVRLHSDAEDIATVAVEASFTDGTRIGPVEGGQACEAPNLAPLEAFRVVLTRIGAPAAVVAPTIAAAAAPAAKAKPTAKAPAKPVAKPVAKPEVKKPDAKKPVAPPKAKPVARPAARAPAKPAGRAGRPKGRRG